LLLAGVWIALGSPEDAPPLVAAAHRHAITAALGLADAARTPPPPRLVTRMLLAPVLQVTWSGAFKDRPRSLRLGQSYTMSVFGFKLLHVEQYVRTK
jgi:hypothetical protein